MTGVNGVGSTVQGNVPAEGPRRELTLKAEDFLQLLAAQLRYQNPLEPLDNTQFMGQLVQFAVLQELVGLREEVQRLGEDLRELQQEAAEQEIGRALQLVGLEVTVREENGSTRSGIVGGIKLVNGVPRLLVDGVEVDLGAVVEVRSPEPAGTSAALAMAEEAAAR